MSKLTQKRLKEILRYDPENGYFYWSVSKAQRTVIGTRAGTLKKTGYRVIQINKKMYQEARLAWLYVNGKFPEKFIDHINRNKSDNRISNLREATISQNGRNSDARNKSGYKGVYKVTNGPNWYAQLQSGDKLKYLGVFSTKEAAYRAVVKECKNIDAEFYGV